MVSRRHVEADTIVRVAYESVTFVPSPLTAVKMSGHGASVVPTRLHASSNVACWHPARFPSANFYFLALLHFGMTKFRQAGRQILRV
jgi:hypothetical protein